MNNSGSIREGGAILLFDGVCNTCNALVDFILKYDHERQFHFAPLQSEIGKDILNQHQIPFSMDTMVLVEADKAYKKSEAAFRIFYLLGWPWRALSFFSILPRPLTDFFYRLFAKNRYALFGKSETCRIMTKEERALFVEKE